MLCAPLGGGVLIQASRFARTRRRVVWARGERLRGPREGDGEDLRNRRWLNVSARIAGTFLLRRIPSFVVNWATRITLATAKVHPQGNQPRWHSADARWRCYVAWQV